MANEVDLMSDTELRNKLDDYGFSKVPITSSTRNLLVKRLKLALDNKMRSTANNETDSRTAEDSSTVDFTKKKQRRANTGKHVQNSDINNDKDKQGSANSDGEKQTRKVSTKTNIYSKSDEELRTKLIQLEKPLIPITDSTRNTLTKMLEKVSGMKSKKEQSTLSGDSSERSDDNKEKERDQCPNTNGPVEHMAKEKRSRKKKRRKRKPNSAIESVEENSTLPPGVENMDVEYYDITDDND